ncbi:hypothetical protein EDC04DRAFT_2609521 [Pisolithus marmoratus]|nr:hypothetical protein EDC04DRAFT_2609521 [Pisolithus marmoratus]
MSNAIDVDNIIDYREMVNKLLEDKPPVVKIFVDMQHIEKLSQGSKSRGSEDDSEVTSDDNAAYKNEHDEGLTYIGPLRPIPLMPAMVHNWCLALEDRQATIAVLPNIELFNAANKVPTLHPACKMLAQLDSSLLNTPTPPSASMPSTSSPTTPQTPTQQ